MVCVVCPHIKRNAQVTAIFPHLIDGGHAGKTELIFKIAIGFNDLAEVVIGQKTPCSFAGDFIDGIDKKDLVSPFFRLCLTADDYAGFHRRVVKKVRPQAQHAFHHVVSHQLFAHGAFFVSKQYAMREKNGAAAGFGFHAGDDVLPESVVGTALGRRTVYIAAPGVG